LACQFYPPCQSALYLDVQGGYRLAATAPTDSLPPPNFNDCSRLATVTAQGTGLNTNFSWTVNGQPRAASPTRPDVISFVIYAGRTYDVEVQVSSSCDGSVLTETTQVAGTFPNCRTAAPAGIAMYPNPAASSLDFEPATPDANPAEYEVRLYDGHGALRWQGRSVGGKLHVACGGLPRGIYGVVTTQGKTVVRRNLSLE
jgi:hypothetical protein